MVDGEWSTNTGRVAVTGPGLQLKRKDGTGHPRRHALGVFTNRQVAGAFARPRFNAPRSARTMPSRGTILTTLASLNAGSTEAEAVIG